MTRSPPTRQTGTQHSNVLAERSHIVYQVLNADHYLEGALPETLQQLRAATLALSDENAVAVRRDAVERSRARWRSETDAAEQRSRDGVGIDPITLASVLRDIVRAERAVIVDETITHSRVVQRHVGWDRPDSYFYVQGGLGQGIAVALGVKLAVRDGLVVLTIGDGAFLYNPIVQSLLAAKDFGLPLLIVIFNKKKYPSMKMNHLRFYPEGSASSRAKSRQCIGSRPAASVTAVFSAQNAAELRQASDWP